MEKEIRKNEIINAFKSCGRTAYYRDEVLPELLALQRETVEMTFNKSHSELVGLRVIDVLKHLEILNEQHDNIATNELEIFRRDCKELNNLIKANISGSKGESYVERQLAVGCSNSLILKNVELTDNDEHTEVDFVVINPSGVIIVEVKNTSKNVFIDSIGDFYRVGEYNRLDSHLGYKMNLRKKILNKLLEEHNCFDVPIESVVVFTNNSIEVRNKCDHLVTCFLTQISSYVSNFNEKGIIDSKKVYNIINEGADRKTYPLQFDSNGFKTHFAEVMVSIEFFDERETTIDTFDITNNESDDSLGAFEKIKMFVKTHPIQLATAVTTIASTIIIGVTTLLTVIKNKK